MKTKSAELENLAVDEKPEPKLSLVLSKDDIALLKKTPASTLKEFGFASSEDLLNTLGPNANGDCQYLMKIRKVPIILPGQKGGDKNPEDKDKPTDPNDWLPNPEELLDLSEEAKEALKMALAVVCVLGVVGICASNPALIPAAARAISIIAPAFAPRAMNFAP
ncbi:MAG: hypothetical protein IAF58_10805 [Leptolyngbya sp.]|nr:hypothetical protein [Candidatus Melainabacteria bacterium]